MRQDPCQVTRRPSSVHAQPLNEYPVGYYHPIHLDPHVTTKTVDHVRQALIATRHICTMSQSDVNAPNGALPSYQPQMPVQAPRRDVSSGPLLGGSYKLVKKIGEGAYGVVYSAIHVPTSTRVAVKRITPFDHQMFCLRTLREIRLLRHFHHENIISILDILPPASFEQFTDVYLVQELMETDLHRIIRTQDLSNDHFQYFVYQILRGLKALHSAGVLHRDLKPSNLLLNANCDMKICDFGLARSAEQPEADNKAYLTEYVATRWYRAPEIMLSFKEYTKAIDLWSVGCIFAEMLTGRPLFPGRDYHHQLSLILGVLGTPSLDDFYSITSSRSRDYIRSLPYCERANFAELFPRAEPLALDLLEKLLAFSPKKRITVEEALAHPYLEPYHDPSDEPDADPLDPKFFDADFSKEPLTRAQLKELIYREITH